MKWQVRGNGMGSGSSDMLMYGFKYDEQYQLKEARFGTVTSAAQGTFNTSATAATGKYNVYNLGYDLNGNITRMTTNGSAGTVYEDLTYEICGLSGTMQNDTPTDNRHVGVKKDGSYYRQNTFNAIGQITTEWRQGNNANTIAYDSYGNVTSSTISSVSGANFYYNDRGQRLKKESKNSSGVVSNTTWYIRDVAGNVLAIYDDNNAEHSQKQTEIPIYGISRLGVYYKASVSYIYELKDHLGNIRASVARAKVSGAADIRSWGDYHPFGSVLQGREQVSADGKRYDYQADNSEKDGETGWNSFELRMYDAQMGRWMSPDPYGQYWSPYVGMGNNPVNGVDPDGGNTITPNYSSGGDGGSENFSGPGGVPQSYKDAYDATKGFTTGTFFGTTAFDYIKTDWSPTKGGKGFFSILFGNSSNTSGEFNNTSGAMAGSVGSGYGNLNGGGLEGITASLGGGPIVIPYPATYPWIDEALKAFGAVGSKVAILTTFLTLEGDRTKERDPNRVYVTYTKQGKDGKVYVGRTSGYGDPFSIVAARDRSHHRKGMGPAVLDKSAVGEMGKYAIRGREQQMIDFFGGAISDGNPNTRSANLIRGVSKYNPAGYFYHHASDMQFGNVSEFTGVMSYDWFIK